MTERMKVTRVEENFHGYSTSSVVPPMDDQWPLLTKLRWHAAVIEYDTSLRLDVKLHGSGGYLVFTGPGSGATAMSYTEAWHYMTDLGRGAEALNRQNQAYVCVEHEFTDVCMKCGKPAYELEMEDDQ